MYGVENKSLTILRDLTRPQDIPRTYQWLYRIAKILSPEGITIIDMTDIEHSQELYRMSNLEFTFSNWPCLFEKDDPVVRRMLKEISENSVVIGYELPPSHIKILREEERPFVNFILHPVRFMDDVFYSVDTNLESLTKYISPFEISDDEIYSYAAIISATLIDPELQISPQNVFIGQTAHDRSLIHEGRIMTFKEIESILPNNVVIKPHPYNQVVPYGYEGIETPIYNLLANASPNLNLFSLSSSVIHEAKYFNVAAQRMIPADQNILPPLRHPYLHSQFWEAIFGDVSLMKPSRIVFPANTIRCSLRQFWGFEQINGSFLVQLVLEDPRFPWRTFGARLAAIDLLRGVFRNLKRKVGSS